MPNTSTHRESVSESIVHGAEQDHHDTLEAPYRNSSNSNKSLRPPRQPTNSNRNPSFSRGLSAGSKAEYADTEQSNSAGHSGDSVVQTPETTGVRRPVESAIWDWDTPLESIGDAASYHYEPQGELMQEQRERSTRPEFSIPQPLAASNPNWPYTSTNEGFAVPRRIGPLALSSAAGVKRKSTSDREYVTNQASQKRASRTLSESGEEGQSPADGRPQAQGNPLHNGSRQRSQSGTETGESKRQPSVTDLDTLRPPGAVSNVAKRSAPETSTQSTLPARKVFPVQVGDKLFRLSGASISSDGPSYFTQFFEEQLRQNEVADGIRTLYIDRDPETFEDIALHLQGYHIEPRDGPHFVKLFADAQFFSLPRLTNQLYSTTIYIRIGDEEFQISRDLFSAPGDSPNYFSLGFSIFFSSPSEVFPGLSQRALLRPPSILPPSIPNRSAKIFSDLLHILKGYPVEIRNEEHRAALLRDARYFHLKGLEQRLIPHQIAYNLARKRSEIVIRIEDIRQSGISFVADNAAPGKEAASTPVSPASSTAESALLGPGWVYYQRPYVDSEAHSLIIEISCDESTFLHVAPRTQNSPARVCRATFHRQTLSRITSLFSVIANKMDLPVNQPLGLMMEQRNAGVASLPVSPCTTGLSEEKVKVRIGPDAHVTVDGRLWTVSGGAGEADSHDGDESPMDVEPSISTATRKSRSTALRQDAEDGEEWIVKKAQYRLRVQPVITSNIAGAGAGAGGSGSGGGSGGNGSSTGGSALRRPRGCMEVILGAVKIEAYSNERGRNSTRGFLA